MVQEDWKSILGAIQELPSGLSTEHVASMARWFRRFFEASPPEGSSLLPDSQTGERAGLGQWSFVQVRLRMEHLGSGKALRAHQKALLCAWVWSLEGNKEFCSNDAQKLYGERGGNLNAHHFNQQASSREESDTGSSTLIRIEKGRYRLTELGREEGARLAREHLFAASAEGEEMTS